jgi:methylenetetrahydrofolate reductase (NADPH)
LVHSYFIEIHKSELIHVLVHNDFHQTHGLFPLFDGLEVEDLDKPVMIGKMNEAGETNGVNDAKSDGIENIPFANGVAQHF